MGSTASRTYSVYVHDTLAGWQASSLPKQVEEDPVCSEEHVGEFRGVHRGSSGILEATREITEAMRLGTDPKAAMGPGRGELVGLTDEENPPSASLTH